jgi:hypothetical protein
MTDARWKRQERETARLLGTRRLPNTGHGQPDLRIEGWAVEHKSRRTLPAWLTGALDQAARNTVPGARPAVILTAPGRGRRLRRVVVMDLAVWRSALASDARPNAGDGGEHAP